MMAGRTPLESLPGGRQRHNAALDLLPALHDLRAAQSSHALIPRKRGPYSQQGHFEPPPGPWCSHP